MHVDGAVLAVVVVQRAIWGCDLALYSPLGNEQGLDFSFWNAISHLASEGFEGDSSSPEFPGSLAYPWKAVNQTAFSEKFQ
jgi:hypothetical protein